MKLLKAHFLISFLLAAALTNISPLASNSPKSIAPPYAGYSYLESKYTGWKNVQLDRLKNQTRSSLPEHSSEFQLGTLKDATISGSIIIDDNTLRSLHIEFSSLSEYIFFSTLNVARQTAFAKVLFQIIISPNAP